MSLVLLPRQRLAQEEEEGGDSEIAVVSEVSESLYGLYNGLCCQLAKRKPAFEDCFAFVQFVAIPMDPRPIHPGALTLHLAYLRLPGVTKHCSWTHAPSFLCPDWLLPTERAYRTIDFLHQLLTIVTMVSHTHGNLSCTHGPRTRPSEDRTV